MVMQIEPKENLCGMIYVPKDPLCRENESFAIADMSKIALAYPHYHSSETEIYFILQGHGLVVVGGEEKYVGKHSVVVIPPMTAHFTIPTEGLVLAVVCTPPYTGELELPVHLNNPLVKYDASQLAKLKPNALIP